MHDIAITLQIYGAYTSQTFCLDSVLRIITIAFMFNYIFISLIAGSTVINSIPYAGRGACNCGLEEQKISAHCRTRNANFSLSILTYIYLTQNAFILYNLNIIFLYYYITEIGSVCAIRDLRTFWIIAKYTVSIILVTTYLVRPEIETILRTQPRLPKLVIWIVVYFYDMENLFMHIKLKYQ